MNFDDISQIKETSTDEGDMFAKLKALKNAGYISKISVNLKGKTGKTFDWECLSEGEKQLSLLLLLTSFTSKYDCLYLFDEFDAYLHLNWQRKFSQMLTEVDVNGHIIFTTHSPATISEVLRDELYLMQDGNVIYPSNETYKRALNEIMEEQMDISMRSLEIDALYDKFKQSVADENKQLAEKYASELASILDKSDPMLIKLQLILRRMNR